MKVSKLMTREVLTCQPTDSLNRAAQIMWEHDCGCVPVVGPEGEVLGMITDRDACMAAYTRGQTLGAMSVAQVMSGDPSVCRTTDEVDVALHAMAERQLHRLPVVDDDRHLVGMLSLSDVVQGMNSKGAVASSVPSGEVLEALSAVTRPRVPRQQSARRVLLPAGA